MKKEPQAPSSSTSSTSQVRKRKKEMAPGSKVRGVQERAELRASLRQLLDALERGELTAGPLAEAYLRGSLAVLDWLDN
jgi:hypothetical protein